jgi:hypothetical protein
MGEVSLRAFSFAMRQGTPFWFHRSFLLHHWVLLKSQKQQPA